MKTQINKGNGNTQTSDDDTTTQIQIGRVPRYVILYCSCIIFYFMMGAMLWQQQNDIKELRNIIEVRTNRAIENDVEHEKRYGKLLDGEITRMETVKNCLENQNRLFETQDYILGIINLE